jgi:hypothetical protein
VRVRLLLALIAVLLLAAPAGAEIVLPPGFSVRAYVTGDGFDADRSRSGRGIPSTSTLAFDDAGNLYLARVGRRYSGGEVYDLWPLYRIPPGGARLTPESEPRFLYGPPLPNAQVAGIRGGRELFVTTFDRDRRIGVLYRMVDGRVELFAGGTPAAGARPLLRQPEGAAIDPAGNVYVADRDQGAIVRLDRTGQVLDPTFVTVTRPRVVVLAGEQLWIGADGNAEAPWQPGPGEIWKVGADRERTLVLRGPMPAAMHAGPGGRLFVADRQGAVVFALTEDGRRFDVARFTDGDAPRTLGFAPATEETRRAGIAGDLFVAVIRRGAWPTNEIVRISGPFESLGENLRLPPLPARKP